MRFSVEQAVISLVDYVVAHEPVRINRELTW